jgi:hypothetical protein
VKKIERVGKEERHTLVVKQGGQTAHLRFNEEVTAAELLSYCEDRLGWQVANLPFVLDGERYAASKAADVRLQPSTDRVDVGVETRASVLEVTRDVGSKG